MARYDDPVKYTKKLVLETSDGQVTLTQNEARTMQKVLEDNARFVKLYNSETKETVYYDMGSKACGFCKVATLTSGKEAGDAPVCEDPIPNCPEKTFVKVTPLGDGKENPARDGWYEKDGDDFVATADTTVVEGKDYFKTEEFEEVTPEADADPSALGLYELTAGGYYAVTADTTVTAGKAYYKVKEA